MESQNMTFGELLTELKSRLGDSAPKNDAALTSFLQEAHEIMWCQLNPISAGQEERPRFTQPQDRPGVSDRLVLLYALALAKSHYRLPGAQVAVSACANLLRLEKIRKHQLQRGAAMTPVKDCRTCQFAKTVSGKDGGRMKQYTDSERKAFMVNKAVVKGRHGNHMVIEVLWPTPSCKNSRVVKELTDWHQTLDEAIDDAMNRQAERRANEALKNMTGGNAG